MLPLLLRFRFSRPLAGFVYSLAPLLLLAVGGCAIRPSAVTVGQLTVVIDPPKDLVEQHLLDVHEAVHREQYRRSGVPGFLTHYLFHVGRRVEWEAEAFAVVLCRTAELGASEIDMKRRRTRSWLALRKYLPRDARAEQRAAEALNGVYRAGEGCGELMRSFALLPEVPQEIVGALAPPEPVKVDRNDILSAPKLAVETSSGIY